MRFDVMPSVGIDAVHRYTTFGMASQMYPHGAGRGQWRWLLMSDLINLCVSRGRLNCVAMVRCSSEYLWSCQNLEVAIVNRPEHCGKIIRKRKEQYNIQKGVEATLSYGTSLFAWV